MIQTTTHATRLTAAQAAFVDTHWRTMSLHALAERLGVHDDALRARLTARGVDFTALTQPEQAVRRLLAAYSVRVDVHRRLALRRPDGAVRRMEIDFLVNDRLAIEVQGDFWHGNPALFPVPTARQRRQTTLDAEKRALLEAAGYAYLELWEDELLHRPADAERRLCAALEAAGVPSNRLDEPVYANGSPSAPADGSPLVDGSLRTLLSPTPPAVHRHGCVQGQLAVHPATTLCLATGERVAAGTAVAERLRGPFLTWDGAAVVPAEAVGWGHVHVPSWTTVTAFTPGSVNGCTGFTAPGGSVVTTADGPRTVDELQPGDRLISWYTALASVDPVLDQVLTGTLLGDGGLTWKASGGTAALLLANGDPAQAGYLRWKLDLLRPLGMRPYAYGAGHTRWQSAWSAELARVYMHRFYRPGVRRTVIPADTVLTPLAAAIWFADDGWAHHAHGALSMRRLAGQPDEDGQVALAKTALLDLVHRATGQAFTDEHLVWQHAQGRLILRRRFFEVFGEVVAPYVHPDVARKLPLASRGLFTGVPAELLGAPGGAVRVTCACAEVRTVGVSARANRAHRGCVLTFANGGRPVAGGEPGLVT